MLANQHLSLVSQGSVNHLSSGATQDVTVIGLSLCLLHFFVSLLSQLWMTVVATALPVPCGTFMPVFVIGKREITVKYIE